MLLRINGLPHPRARYLLLACVDGWSLDVGVLYQILSDCADLVVLDLNPKLGDALRFVETNALSDPPPEEVLVIYPLR